MVIFNIILILLIHCHHVGKKLMNFELIAFQPLADNKLLTSCVIKLVIMVVI